jgi:phosphoribosylformylglycinamidine synthase subunit PurL
VAGEPPVVDLLAERRLQHAVLALIQKGLARSAHDCSEGGLAPPWPSARWRRDALRGRRGLDDDLAPVALFFGETQGRVLVTVAPDEEDRALDMAREPRRDGRVIGTVGPAHGVFSVRSPRGQPAIWTSTGWPSDTTGPFPRS